MGTPATNETAQGFSLFIAQDGTVCLFYDRPLSAPASWVEYTPQTAGLQILLQTGEPCPLAMPVPDFYQHLVAEAKTVSLIQLDRNKRVVKGDDVPLLVKNAG